jgi:hypothetical protein
VIAGTVHDSTNRLVENESAHGQMFNQLTPSEVVTAIGATLRGAARGEGQASDFGRDQLMSAYSATRHLAVELVAYEPELRNFTASVSDQIRAAEVPGLERELALLADRIGRSRDPSDIGEALCELFELLRRTPSPQARALRTSIHVKLRSLADREVDLLADALS